MANKEMKTIQFPNSDTVYEIVDNAAREALAGKQPTGDYATTESLNAHTGNTNNPHGVTKSQVGLENVANERQYSASNPPPYPVTSVAGRTDAVTLTKADVGLSNVDNTSDTAKPVSTAQATAIAEAKQAGTNAQNAIDTHAGNTSNPHNVTAAQVGAYVKPAEGIPETDLSAANRAALNYGVPNNLINEPIILAESGEGVFFAQSDYGLNLEIGNQYEIFASINGKDYWGRGVGFPVPISGGNAIGLEVEFPINEDAYYGVSVLDRAKHEGGFSPGEEPIYSTANWMVVASISGTEHEDASITSMKIYSIRLYEAYIKPSTGIPETDLSAEVQEKLNASGGDTAVNLLQSSVTANRQAGVTEGDMVNLGYALGLEEGKMYTVKYRFNDADIVATAKYESPSGLPLQGGELCLCQSISAEGMTMAFPLLLGVSAYNPSIEDYQNAAMNYGYLIIVDKHQITGDMTYSDDENNSSVYTRAVQTSSAGNAVSIEITAIELFTEVVADKVKNPLTIGDVVFDGSAAKTVDLSEMSVGNATNLIPDENGAVNPGGRGSGTVGNSSTALGEDATAAGVFSTALGRLASAAGGTSTALGYYATAVGNNSIALGYGANASGTNSAALGGAATTSESDSNVIQLGSDSLSVLRSKVNLTVTSDKRDKADINTIANALTFIDRLNPVTFVSNDRVNYISDEDKKGEKFRKYGMCDYDRVSHSLGTKKGERRRCGLLAQEVVAAMQTVYGTDNYANIVNDNFHDLAEKPSDVENKYTLAYANLVPFLIGAIKELNAKIKILEDKNNV